MKKYNLILITFFGLLCGCSFSNSSEPYDNRVSLLVEKITKSKQEQKDALKELEHIEKEAIPYIVAQLGDMRLLAERSITIENRSPKSFEAIRHYTPETVHDALAVILNKITGQHFVFVYNGSNLKNRTENTNQWVDWCIQNYPNQTNSCNRARKYKL